MSDVRENPANLKMLEDWIKIYRPKELFDAQGRLVPELRALSPRGARRTSANAHANGGLLRKDHRCCALYLTRRFQEPGKPAILRSALIRRLARRAAPVLNINERAVSWLMTGRALPYRLRTKASSEGRSIAATEWAEVRIRGQAHRVPDYMHVRSTSRSERAAGWPAGRAFGCDR
jgi:hypothetical protein